jgi:DNA-directed RNA polymerase specialized sigma24 family protein
MLSVFEELSHKEIEKITGLSTAKIKSNLYLAKKKIREKIHIIIE